MEQNNYIHAWKIAMYQDAGSLMARELIYPVAVRNNDGIEVVKAVWEQCRSTLRGVLCTVFYPPVDAIIYLLARDYWREVEVVCYRRATTASTAFCNRLKEVAEDIWKRRPTKLGPSEFIDALPIRWSLL